MQYHWKTIERIESSNENVAKFVFKNKNAVAEAVLYKYPTYEERTVICCSTMAGCPVGCRFCGAGDHFARSLSEAEIVEQVNHLVYSTGVASAAMEKLQIMFMSMGEPFLNYVQLEKSLKSLSDLYPSAKLLVSTSAPRNPWWVSFGKVSKKIKNVGLQFSVHESTDEARDKLIPYKDKLTLREISKEGQRWYMMTGRKPFINYCVHDKNDSDLDADRLLNLFPPEIFEYTLSVICERDEHIAAANERQRALVEVFMDYLMRNGASCRMFDPAGQDDIGGGCGQLWFVQDWMKRNSNIAKPTIGTGKEKVHTPV